MLAHVVSVSRLVVSHVLTRYCNAANVRQVTGISLKLHRVGRRVKVVDLAAAMGVTHGRVSQIESADKVSTAIAARYLAALATLPDVTKGGGR